MKKLFFVVVFILQINIVFAADPVLFFSDLTSGPGTGWEQSTTKGAAVTIWGLNLGTSRGNSYVAVGDQHLTASSDYAEWGATNNNAALDAQNTQQRITFFLNNNMPAGDTTITVTVDGVTSNGIDFAVRNLGSNHIYFIDGSGSNSSNGLCATGQGSCGPWQTIAFSKPSNGNVIPGDIVYIRNGTYDEEDNGNGGAIEIRNRDGAGGTEDMPFAWVGYPTERPKLTNGLINVHWPAWAGRSTPFSYVTISKFEFENSMNHISNTGWGDGWRFIGNFFDLEKGHNQGGVASCRDCKDTFWFGNKFSGGGGDDWDHLIYPGNKDVASGILDNHHVAYNEVFGYDGTLKETGNRDFGGAVFNIRPNGYSGGSIGTIYYYNNYMHDCGYAQFIYVECDGPTDYIYVYNNIVTNVNIPSPTPANGLILIDGKSSSGPRTMYVYNNIFYESGADSRVLAVSNNVTMYSKNNIIYESVGQKYTCANCQDYTFNSDNDLMYGAGAEPTGSRYTITNKISLNPQFVNPAANIFQYRGDSPAIDEGTPAISPIVTNDLLGINRPRGLGYDIGAYENVDLVSPDSPKNLRIVK